MNRSTRGPVYCHRCGCEIADPKPRQKYCADCYHAVKAMRQAQSRQRKLSPDIPRPSDVTRQARSHTKANEAELRLLSGVADWAGLTYGKLMLKPAGELAELITAYKAAHKGR